MYFESIKKEVAVDLIDFQIALQKYNGYIQRLFLTLDSTHFILKPYDALQLANDYKKIKHLKYRFERGKVPKMDTNQNKFFIDICSDIISNYKELLELETSNNGNLSIATQLVYDSSKEPFNLNIFNYQGRFLDSELLKIIKEL